MVKTVSGGRAQSIGRRGKVEQVSSDSGPLWAGGGGGRRLTHRPHNREGTLLTALPDQELWLLALSLPCQILTVGPKTNSRQFP